jgi:light-regulated signal transduction histidine kinase (bacteriophytochrome)
MVTGFMQLLHKNYSGKLDPTADKYIGFAVDGAKRMQRLIEDLLAYSRVGTKAREPEPIPAGDLVRLALSNLSVAIEESKAQIKVKPLPTVSADGPQLVQVFQNLIGNAIKFRKGEGPTIEVNACRDGDAWLFSVKDNGIGFSPEFDEKVFMIFQRLHTKDKYPGTGIGLAICKKIVERHHGRIWAESTPGQGSTFYFTLPA